MLKHLRWLTILSLDAPLVAVVWQWMLAESLNARLHWQHRLLLFTSVWLGYTADRWLDTRKTAAPASAQHRFTRRNSRRFLAAWSITLLASGVLAIAQLDAHDLLLGIALAGFAIAYTGFAQRCRKMSYYGVSKGAFIAILVSASAVLFVPRYALATPPGSASLLIMFLLFFYNCLSIRSWEKPASHSARIADPVAFAAFTVTLLSSLLWPQLASLSLSATLALTSLWLLNRAYKRLEPSLARTLADVSLLTPLLFLFAV